MKRLTLVRHAQAESALEGQADCERALARRGMEDAAEMSRRLRLRRLHVDSIKTSPAPRAAATAEIFARALKIAADWIDKDDRLYTAGPGEFLAAVRAADDTRSHLLIVAHNPGIAEFADRLSDERRIDAMPTCAFVTIKFE